MNKDYFTYLNIQLEQKTKYALLLNQFADTPIETLAFLHDVKVSADFTALTEKLRRFHLFQKHTNYWTLSFRSNFSGQDEKVFIEGSLEEIYVKATIYIKWLKDQTEIVELLSNFKLSEK